MHAALTIARWVLGSILIYAAIFLYEDQEGRIQNTLEEWWIKIEDNRSKAVSKSAIFFRAVARVTNGVFDYLFGQDLFSSESIGSSFCLSASSLFISFSLSDILDRGMPKTVKHPVLFGGFGIAFFLLSLVRHLFNEHTWERVRDFWLLAISTVVVGPLIIGKGYPLLGGLLISFCLDIGYIILTRFIVRRTTDAVKISQILMLLIVNTLVFVGMVAFVMIPTYLDKYVPNTILFGMLFFCVFGVLISLSFIIVASIALLHRFLWPVLGRCVYATARFKVIQNKKLLYTMATILFFGPHGWELVQKLLEKAA